MSNAITWNGDPIPFKPGETVAQALGRAGIIGFGPAAAGSDHSVFCGIGQCQNCLVMPRGRGATEACLLLCQDGMEITRVRGHSHD